MGLKYPKHLSSDFFHFALKSDQNGIEMSMEIAMDGGFQLS